MTSIYDDVYYVVNEREKDYDTGSGNYSDLNVGTTPQVESDVIKILDCINRKTMFQKLLKETLAELNKTNPSLETGKYHMLCIYTKRYNNYINKIEDEILWYELRTLHMSKKQISKSWFWTWKLMDYFGYEHKVEPDFIEKMFIEKKND